MRGWMPILYRNAIKQQKMANNNSMISQTKLDFDVELLATDDESALFADLRKGGAKRVSTAHGPWQTHVMGVWHFVAVTGHGNIFQNRQWHIPRYVMAREMALRNRVFEQFGNRSGSPIAGAIGGLPTRMANSEKLEIHLQDGVIFTLDPAFTRKLQDDIPLLEKAQKKVRERGDMFYIPELKTPAGHDVESSSRELMEAIAFENLTLKRLTAENFGIYSAYCTYRDFDTSVEFPDDLIRELVKTQFECDIDTQTSDEMGGLIALVQKKLLTKPIWGKGIKMKPAQAEEILAEGIKSLARHQRVQFILMNGMHSAGLFLPLAMNLGFCTDDQYAEYMCQGFAPDSPEEQERRKEIAYIKLYGKLAEQCPNLE